MSSRLPQPVDDLVTGLQAEARALRRRRPSDVPIAKLVDGRAESSEDGARTYRFTQQRWPKGLDAGRALVIRSGSSDTWHPVQHCAVSGSSVTVTCAAALGTSDIRGEVRQDDAESCELLVSALEGIGQQQDGAALRRGRRVFGTQRTKTADFDSAHAVTTELSRLNAAQHRAVQRALGSDVTYLWGPPGTGKTEVVSRIVEGYVRRGFRVLFTAPTNVAVDQALERVCELLGPLPEFWHGLIQRQGDVHLATLRDSYGTAIDRDQSVARDSQELNQRAAELRESQEAVTADLKTWSNLEQHIETLRQKQARRADYGQRVQPRLDEISNTESHIVSLQQRLSGDRSGQRPMRRRAQHKQEQLAQELRAEEDKLAQLREAVRGPLTTLEGMDREITELRDRIEREKPDHLEPRQELERQAEQVQQELARITQRLRQIERDHDENCRVIAMTTQRSYRSRASLRTDVVVVDEAGMVELPTVFYLAAKAASALVFAGDFRQLPAVVTGNTDTKAAQAERDHVQQWLARDAFSAGGVATTRGINTEDPRLVRLDTQYRMRKGICDLVNAVAYPEAPLLTGRDDAAGLGESPLLEAPLVLIDTSDTISDGGTATYNYVHATLIREFVRLLQNDEVLPSRRAQGAPPESYMAAIAPYRNQVSAISKQLQQRFGSGRDGIVDTVHRFQGSQRALLIVDTVTGASKHLGWFFDGVGLDSDTTRLLNVALSRARDHLVVVANVAHLSDKLQVTSEVHQLLEHLTERAQRVPPEDLIPIRVAEELDELSDEDRARPAFFPVDETDAAVQWDIERATTRIEIYCAFMNKPRIEKYRKPLRAAVERGVGVSVFTRDPSQTPENGPLIEILRAEGCEVITRDQMHEKVVVVDDVLWFGSLNLFAHTRSTELMMRLADREACESVRTRVENAKPTKQRSMQPQPDGPPPEGRLELNVPFAEKDQAKKLGARWDPGRKTWWIDPSKHSPETFSRWRPKDM